MYEGFFQSFNKKVSLTTEEQAQIKRHLLPKKLRKKQYLLQEGDAHVSSHIGREPYRIEIKSPTGNIVIADEPIDKGGKDTGFSPKELLASALAACTSATVMMYANRNKLDLHEVKIEIDLVWIDATNKTMINRKVQFIGNLDKLQRTKLLNVANACPVHKILNNPIDINTEAV